MSLIDIQFKESLHFMNKFNEKNIIILDNEFPGAYIIINSFKRI